jgi:hypothetical protein
MTHPILKMTREGTSQNFALRKGDIEQYVGTEMRSSIHNL